MTLAHSMPKLAQFKQLAEESRARALRTIEELHVPVG